MKTVANKSRDDLNSSAKRKRILCRGLVYLFAIVMAITAFYPFFVMIISSTHDNYNIVAKINVLPFWFASGYKNEGELWNWHK